MALQQRRRNWQSDAHRTLQCAGSIGIGSRFGRFPKNKEETPMFRKALMTIAAIAMLGAAAAAQGQFGSAAEAKALLEKAIAAVKADKAKALADFNAGAGGFKDRDLYVFCAGPDGIITAHPSIKGQQIKSLVDKNGKKLGEEIVANAAEGKIAEVSYMWPRPGADTTPVAKVSFVTKVADQVCGVGYYK
jgi:signal transduction histidine kinase